jgi:hypothetical protein
MICDFHGVQSFKFLELLANSVFYCKSVIVELFGYV